MFLTVNSSNMRVHIFINYYIFQVFFFFLPQVHIEVETLAFKLLNSKK